jgi:hypothetical protein
MVGYLITDRQIEKYKKIGCDELIDPKKTSMNFLEIT